jgi:hypothetical protein
MASDASPPSADGRAEFAAAVDQMERLLQQLEAAPCLRVAEHPVLPAVPGVYLFTDGKKPIYVGQSRSLRRRLRIHTRPTSRHNQASFAFNLAKREARLAGVDIVRRRKTLGADAAFEVHFAAARAAVAQMSVQFVEVPDPIVRTMFEMYVSLVLDTREFNSFETH